MFQGDFGEGLPRWIEVVTLESPMAEVRENDQETEQVRPVKGGEAERQDQVGEPLFRSPTATSLIRPWKRGHGLRHLELGALRIQQDELATDQKLQRAVPVRIKGGGDQREPVDLLELLR